MGLSRGSFSKEAAPFAPKTMQGTGDGTLAGALSTAPAGAYATQFNQNLPGDCIIFTTMDAQAVSNNNIGNLWGGTYRYVLEFNNSTSLPGRGHGAFWYTGSNNNAGNAVTDELYEVTSDEPANQGVSLLAGVYIGNLASGNYGWIQETGKATVKFRTAITNVANANLGMGVYSTAGGNNNNAADIGSFDLANNAANSITTGVGADALFVRFVGVTEQVPSNNNLSLIDMVANRIFFRA